MAVGVGASGSAAPTLAAHAAIAPVDHFVIEASADVDPVDEGNGTLHGAGELGLGVFAVGDPRLRAELIAGVGGGYGNGTWYGECDDFALEGPYVRPFAQGAIAAVYDFFTFGGGLRLAVTFTDLQVTRLDPGSDLLSGGFNAQGHIDPFLTMRFRHEIFEVDLTGGTSFSYGNAIVGSVFNAFGALTVRLQFQVWGGGTAERIEEPESDPDHELPTEAPEPTRAQPTGPDPGPSVAPTEAPEPTPEGEPEPAAQPVDELGAP